MGHCLIGGWTCAVLGLGGHALVGFRHDDFFGGGDSPLALVSIRCLLKGDLAAGGREAFQLRYPSNRRPKLPAPAAATVHGFSWATCARHPRSRLRQHVFPVRRTLCGQSVQDRSQSQSSTLLEFVLRTPPWCGDAEAWQWVPPFIVESAD